MLENRGDGDISLVLLPPRVAEPQPHWKCIDGHGRRIVLVARSVQDGLLADMLEHGLPLLRKIPQFPKATIAELAGGRGLMGVHGFLKDLDGAEVGDLGKALKEGIAEYLSTNSTQERDELVGAISGPFFLWHELSSLDSNSYRPLLLLNEPLAPTSKIAGSWQIVKYARSEAQEVGLWELMGQAILGRYRYRFKFYPHDGGSNHFRILVPGGTVIQSARTEPDQRDVSHDGQQVHWYFGKAPDEQGGMHGGRSERRVTVSFAQSLSSRILNLTLLGIVALFPLIGSVWFHFDDAPRPTSLRALGSYLPEDALDTFSSMEPEAVLGASGLAIPVALALVSATWSHPGTRLFSVTQLALASAIIGAYLVAPLLPVFGAAAVASGLALVAYNAVAVAALALPQKPHRGKAD